MGLGHLDIDFSVLASSQQFIKAIHGATPTACLHIVPADQPPNVEMS
jgi:hypothetical protein